VASDLDALVVASSERGAPAPLALVRVANEVAAEPERARGLDADALARLLVLESSGELSASQSKEVLAELLANGGDPAEIARRLGFEPMDKGALAEVVARVIAERPEDWARFIAGEDKVKGPLIGAVRRATDNQADPAAVGRHLEELRASRA
jgi:Asp-tRNA(Asn)/Glu-tRNA(Gln) amidotransferase B subunit